jgi:hypothetical protein
MRQTEEFKAKFCQAQDELLAGAVAALHNNAMLFVKTLGAICEDPTARASEKAQAADRGLNTLCRMRELYLLGARVAKLEQAGEGQK